MGIHRCDLADLLTLTSPGSSGSSNCQPILVMNQTRASLPRTFWLSHQERQIFYPFVDTRGGDQIIAVDLDGSNPQAVRSSENVHNGILDGARNMVRVDGVFYWINCVDQAIRTERLSDGMYNEQNILLDYIHESYILSGLVLWSNDQQNEPGTFVFHGVRYKFIIPFQPILV